MHSYPELSVVNGHCCTGTVMQKSCKGIAQPMAGGELLRVRDTPGFGVVLDDAVIAERGLPL